MLDALAVVLERLRAVAEINCAVEVGVGFGPGQREFEAAGQRRLVDRFGFFVAAVYLSRCFHRDAPPRQDSFR